MAKLALFWLTLLLAGVTAAADLINPDLGVGPVQRTMSRADLDKLGLGDRDLEDSSASLPGVEAILPSTEVFDVDPQRHMTVIWADESRKALRAIVVASPQSRWRTEQGVGVGTPLGQLRALNRRPFLCNGSGEVDDWQGGALASWSGKLTVSLASINGAALPAKLSSDAPQTAAMQLCVSQLQLSFR